MTIPTSLPVRALNNRLSYLERCAQKAPIGTYEEARAAAEVVDDVSNFLLRTLRSAGFKVLNDDRLRAVEAVIYGYILESNPDATGLTAGEGFGEYADGPAGERVMANTIRDRDALAALLRQRAGG